LRPRTLAGEARTLLTRDAAHPPGTWGPAFAREVERYRRHLAPIERVAVLEASFGREAFHRVVAPTARRAGALRAAYGIRWIELTTGLALPPFQIWDEACTRDP
jgi:hypothetical protein